MFEPLTKYMDHHGFIGHEYGTEFGDASQRLGTLWIVRVLLCATINNAAFKKQLDMLAEPDGDGGMVEYTRHWDASQWWGQLGHMSWDNFEPLLMAAYMNNVGSHSTQMINLMYKRHGRMWNKYDNGVTEPNPVDWVPPWVIWAHDIRAHKKKLYPLLWFLDVWIFLQSLVRVLSSYMFPDHVSDDLNHFLRLKVFGKRLWTPWVWAAELVYEFRKDGMYWPWLHYFRHPGNPPMDRMIFYLM